MHVHSLDPPIENPTRVVGRRVAAALIDSLIALAFNTVVFIAMAEKDTEVLARLRAGEIEKDTNSYGNVTLGDHEYSIVGGDFLFYLAIIGGFGIAYHWVLPGLYGWTPGKRLAGIRVVRADGDLAGIWRNAVRNLLWVIDHFPYLVPFVTGFAVAMSSRGNQRVGDKVAGTWVVRKEAFGRPVEAAQPWFASAPRTAVTARPAPPRT